MQQHPICKIAFYADHSDMASYQDVVAGRVASSGSASSVNALLPIAAFYPLTVYHRMGADVSPKIWRGVTWVRVSDIDDMMAVLSGGDDLPSHMIIRSNGESGTLVDRLTALGILPVLMMNNDLPGAVISQLFAHGLAFAVARSVRSLRNYEAFYFCKDIHLVRHSLPHPIGDEGSSPVLNRVVWVGATREEKGFHHLLAAWPAIRAVAPEAELHVYGSIRLHLPRATVGWSGVMTPEFEKAHLNKVGVTIDELRQRGVYLFGEAGKQEVVAAAQSAWVGVVNPNVTGGLETFCISAVELQACGCPVVGGKAGGLIETVEDGVSGLLVSNPADLAAAITSILSNPELRSRLSAGARSHASSFAAIEKEVDAWLKAFGRDRATTLDGIEGVARSASLIRLMQSNFASRLYAKMKREITKIKDLHIWRAT